MGENLKNLINLGDKPRNTSVITSGTTSVTSQAHSTASETVTIPVPAPASVSSEDDGYCSHGELDIGFRRSIGF